MRVPTRLRRFGAGPGMIVSFVVSPRFGRRLWFSLRRQLHPEAPTMNGIERVLTPGTPLAAPHARAPRIQHNARGATIKSHSLASAVQRAGVAPDQGEDATTARARQGGGPND